MFTHKKLIEFIIDSIQNLPNNYNNNWKNYINFFLSSFYTIVKDFLLGIIIYCRSKNAVRAFHEFVIPG